MLHLVILILIGWGCYFLADYLEKKIEKEKERGEIDDKSAEQSIPT